jgi:hypothetical protein
MILLVWSYGRNWVCVYFCARSQTTVESVTVLAPKSEIVRTKWLAFDPAGCDAFA